MTISLPGRHYVGKAFSNAQVAEHWAQLRIEKPNWVVAQGAEQYAEALAFAKAVQLSTNVPTNMIFRHWVGHPQGDNGRICRMMPDELYDQCVAPYHGTGLTIMTENEDWCPDFGEKAARVIERAAENKQRIAIGAFSTHNPPREHWPSLMPMFRAMAQHPGTAIFAPHVYYSKVPSVHNMDGFAHLLALVQHAQQMVDFWPEVVITEFGRLVNKDGTRLDPDAGFSLEIDGRTYANEVIALGAEHFAPWGWDYVIFSEGAWGTRGSLGVDEEYDKRMADIAKKSNPLPPPNDRLLAAWSVVNRLTNDPDWQQATVQKVGHLAARIRRRPSTASDILTTLIEPVAYKIHAIPPDKLTATEAKAVSETVNGTAQTWTQIKLWDNTIGWVRSDAATVKLVAPEPEPDPEPEPAPTPPEGLPLHEAQVRLLVQLFETRGRAYAHMMEGFRLLAEAEQAEAAVYKALLPKEEERDPLFSV